MMSQNLPQNLFGLSALTLSACSYENPDICSYNYRAPFENFVVEPAVDEGNHYVSSKKVGTSDHGFGTYFLVRNCSSGWSRQYFVEGGVIDYQETDFLEQFIDMVRSGAGGVTFEALENNENVKISPRIEVVTANESKYLECACERYYSEKLN